MHCFVVSRLFGVFLVQCCVVAGMFWWLSMVLGVSLLAQAKVNTISGTSYGSVNSLKIRIWNMEFLSRLIAQKSKSTSTMNHII